MMVPQRVVRFLLMSLILPLHAADTGAYRGPENSGVYAEKGLLKEWPPEGPKLLWKQPLNQGYAGVAVVSGLVYIVHGMENHLDVFTLDGERLHHVPTGNASWKRFGGTRSTPIVEGDMAVTTTPDANIYGVDLKTQNVRWKLNAWTNFGSGASAMGWGLPESPLQHDGTAIFDPCSRSDATPPLVAVDIQVGRVVWGADAGRGAKKYSAVDVSGARFHHNGVGLIAYPTYRYLLCADASTGRRLWEIADTGSKNLTPCYSDGRLLWGPAGKVQALRLSPDGTSYDVLWTRNEGIHGFSHAVVMDGRAYLFGNPYMRARTPEEQAALLTEEGIGYVFATPDTNRAPESVRTHGPRALAEWQRQARQETHLLCLDADTGRLIHSRPAADPGHIIAADGMVYVLELLHQGPDKPIVPRVSLIRPTATGFETTGTLVPPLDPAELCWDSQRRARNEQHKQWAREDFLFQRNINPAVAEGRLFLRYGPLQVYDLRGKDWTPQASAPVPVVRDGDRTSANVALIAELAPVDVRQSIKALSSRYLDERTEAVQSLSSLPVGTQKELLPALVKLLDVEGDRAWWVQQAALAVLQTNGPAAVPVSQLLRERALVALDKGNGHLAELLFMTLQAISPAVMTQAVASSGCRLSSENPAVRRQTIAALKVVGPAASVVAEPLAACLASDDRRMVNEAAQMMRSMAPGVRAAVPVLQAGLTNVIARKDPARAERIADVLQGIDSNGVAACAGKLAVYLGETDPGVAGLAMRVLNQAGVACVEAVPQLVKGLKSDDRRVAEQSGVMLHRLGPRATAAVEPLVGYVSGETGTLRVVAAELLGCVGPDARNGVEKLAAGVRATDLPFARASAVALGRIGVDAAPAVPFLVTAVGSRDVELARASAGALGAIGRAVSDAAEKPLIAALRHGDEAVRSNAVASLRMIGRDPVPPLVAILKGTDRRMASWAASALGRMGSDARGAVPELIAAAKSKDAQLVAAAVDALGGIGRDAGGAMRDLLVLSRGADRRVGEAIQRTLDRIKTGNQPPTVADVKAVCEEGKTVTLSLPVSDEDDVVDTLVASVEQGPMHGTLTRVSNTQFVYRAALGDAKEDLLVWRTADRSVPSGLATVGITVVPDRTAPVVTWAFMWTNAPSLRVEFDEPLLASAATDVRSYWISPEVEINSVRMDTNGMAVWLHTGPLEEGRSYMVGVRKLRDRSKSGNALTAQFPVTCLSSGLACDYHETLTGVFERDLFDLAQPKTCGVASRLDLSLRQRDERFLMRHQGVVTIPASGDYTFWLTADDRARLYLGTNTVAESTDGRERSGSIRLGAGIQPLCLIYMQTGGTNILDVTWSGPGFRRQPVSASVLFH